MAAPAEDVHLKFVEGVVKLPAVNLACDVAFHTYQNFKASNRLLNFTLNTVEWAGRFATRQSMPVIRIFENQIKAVDDIACSGLENLKVRAPVITLQFEEVLYCVLNRYGETIQNCLNKLISAEDNMRDQIDDEVQVMLYHCGQMLTKISHIVMDAIEELFLSGEEAQPPGSLHEMPVLTRAEVLTFVLMFKALRKISENIQNATSKVTNTFSYVFSVVNDLISDDIKEMFAVSGQMIVEISHIIMDTVEAFFLSHEEAQPPGSLHKMSPCTRAEILSSILLWKAYRKVYQVLMNAKSTADRVYSDAVTMGASVTRLIGLIFAAVCVTLRKAGSVILSSDSFLLHMIAFDHYFAPL